MGTTELMDMSDASAYKKHSHDSSGKHVPPNTYLRGSKHGLVYYLSFQLNGESHNQCLHVFEGEPDSWTKAYNMSRRIILGLKARNRDLRNGIDVIEEPADASAPSIAPASVGPRYQRTLNYIVQEYVSHHAQTPGVSPTDRAPVRTRAHHLLRLFSPHVLLENVGGADIEAYIVARQGELVRDSTIRRELSVLNCAVKHAIKHKLLPADYVLPDHGVALMDSEPLESHKAKAREPELVAQFLNHPEFPAKHRLRYKVAYASGLRCHELMALTPAMLREMSEGGAQIVLPLYLHAPQRGNDPKRARVDADTYALLMGHIAEHGLGPSDALFPADSMMYRDVERVCKAMGLDAPITLRDLRATFGTELYLANGEEGLAAAQEGLRQKHQAQTATYIKPFKAKVSAWYKARMMAFKPT